MVKQRHKSDCCIAAVANATGTSYASVKKRYGRIQGGLDHSEVVWLLGEYGEWKETRSRRKPTVAEWLPRHVTGRYVLILYWRRLG